MERAFRRLQPLSLSELLDQAFALYRQNFALFAGIVAVLAVPQVIITTAINLGRPASAVTGSGSSTVIHGDRIAASLSLTGVTAIISIVFAALITGALARAISARYLGEQISVVEAYSSLGWSTFVRLAVASIALGFLVALGILTLFIMSVVFFVRYLFISQAIVIERQTLPGAFSRSWRLTRGSFWRVFGYALVIYLIAIIFESIVGGVPSAILALGGQPILSGLFSAIATVLVEPFQLGAVTLLYYDLRVRHEGFDLEHLAGTLT